MKISFSSRYEDKSQEFMEKLKKNFARVMFTMEADARRLVPVDTGLLRNSTNLHKISDLHYELIAGTTYASDVEFGTKPHEIRPVKAKALHFTAGDGEVFAKMVWHPGTNAQPYMRPAYWMARENIKMIIKQ